MRRVLEFVTALVCHWNSGNLQGKRRYFFFPFVLFPILFWFNFIIFFSSHFFPPSLLGGGKNEGERKMWHRYFNSLVLPSNLFEKKKKKNQCLSTEFSVMVAKRLIAKNLVLNKRESRLHSITILFFFFIFHLFNPLFYFFYL